MRQEHDPEISWSVYKPIAAHKDGLTRLARL